MPVPFTNRDDDTTAAAVAPDTAAPTADDGDAPAVRVPPVLGRHVLRSLATEYGVCTRPVPMRRIDTTTGDSQIVDIPCGSTVASKCESCAKRAKLLRMAQCREGWHLTSEPVADPPAPTIRQKELAAARADLHATRTELVREGQDTAEVDDAIGRVTGELAESGVHGDLEAGRRRARSTRRRQDVPDLPRQTVAPHTVGRAYEGVDGKLVRPSLFLTLTCGSYGRVDATDGTPVDPGSYDYRAAARDAIHFAKLVDRFWQNLRRAVGFDVQYFAAVEPQRRLAPHLHAAIRGTIARAVLRTVVAATYHQVWWPHTDTIVYTDAQTSHLR